MGYIFQSPKTIKTWTTKHYGQKYKQRATKYYTEDKKYKQWATEYYTEDKKYKQSATEYYTENKNINNGHKILHRKQQI